MPFMQLRLNSLTYHHEIWYGGIFLQRPKEQHTVNVHRVLHYILLLLRSIIMYFTSVSRWQLQYYTVFKYLCTYKQSGWFYRNVEPLWKTNSHFQHLRIVRTFNNRCFTEKYSANKG